MTNFLLVGNGRPLEEVYTGIRRLGGTVAAVYADPESWNRLNAMGIHPEPASSLREKNSAARVRGLNIDWLLNVQSKIIFSPELLKLPKLGAINFHPGPLPEGAGLTAHEWAILLGEKSFGVTLHYMTEELDGGPIIARRDFEIQETDTGLTLLARAWRLGTDLFCEILRSLIGGGMPESYPQDKTRYRYFAGKAPYGGLIHFEWPARRILDFIRALNYHPLRSPSGPPRFYIGKDEYFAHQAESGHPIEENVEPGTILKIGEEGIGVACGDRQSVRLRDTILPAGSLVPAGPYLLERGITAGDRCGIHPKEKIGQC